MSKFGWSYPPGCTQAMVDEAVGANIPDDDDEGEISNSGYLDYYYADGEHRWFVIYDTFDSTPSWCMWMIPGQEAD